MPLARTHFPLFDPARAEEFRATPAVLSQLLGWLVCIVWSPIWATGHRPRTTQPTEGDEHGSER
jgi:hypothetical protein